MDAIGPVVVGVDGSPNSQRAMRMAAHVADRIDAPLRIVHAVGLTEEIGGRRVPAFDHDEEIATSVEAWCETLREEGRHCYHVDIQDGPPVDVLLRVADRVGASVVVVGRRGVGGRPELRLGSTAHQVIERAHCPVLVIPPIGHSATVTAPR